MLTLRGCCCRLLPASHTDEVNKASPKAKTAETALYAQRADMRLELKVVKGFSGKAAPSLEQRGKEAAELLIPKMKVFLDKQPDFVDRKKRYMEYGFRGDWPDIQPKEWNPVLDAFGRAGAAPAVTP